MCNPSPHPKISPKKISGYKESDKAIIALSWFQLSLKKVTGGYTAKYRLFSRGYKEIDTTPYDSSVTFAPPPRTQLTHQVASREA